MAEIGMMWPQSKEAEEMQPPRRKLEEARRTLP